MKASIVCLLCPTKESCFFVFLCSTQLPKLYPSDMPCSSMPEHILSCNPRNKHTKLAHALAQTRTTSNIPSTMPTRAEFLATGLVPATLSNQTVEDVCGICTDDFSDPVKLECGHIFDSACIATWLKMPRRNACPTCRKRLFELPEHEDPGVGHDRREQIAAAIRTSQVAEPNALSVVEAYGIDTSNVNTASFQRATAHAASYLGEEHHPGLPQHVSGPGVIRNGWLNAGFLAMGNLIPGLARAQGRAYARRQSADWILVLTHLWCILQNQNGKRYDALILPTKLRGDVEAQMRRCYRDVDEIDCFFGPLVDDLDILLNYLTVCCWTSWREEEAIAAKKAETEAARRRARKEAKQSPCAIM